MKRAFLISNSYKIDERRIDSLPLEQGDTVALFNHSVPNKFDRVRCWPDKALFMRENPNIYWGLDHLKACSAQYAKVVCLSEKPSPKYDKIKLVRPDAEIYDYDEMNKDIEAEKSLSMLKDYPKDRMPTSGLMAIVHFALRGHKLFLVEFTGELSVERKINPRRHVHGYWFEQEFFEKMREDGSAIFL